jgi:hypothetical protein
MKKQIAAILFLFIFGIHIKGISQTKFKHQSLSFEIIPAAFMMSIGSGLNIQYGYEPNNRILTTASIGFLYNNYTTGFERELFTSNGVPLAEWSTEVDIETNRPYPLGGVVNSIDFKNIDRLGFKQYKPKMGYRLNRHFSCELLYKAINRKLKLYSGIGIMLGLTNRDDTHVGFTGTIRNDFNGLEERFWININIRAKYLFMGGTAKMNLLYPINDKLDIGLTSGIYYIFDKRFREDIKIPYLGITSKIKLK